MSMERHKPTQKRTRDGRAQAVCTLSPFQPPGSRLVCATFPNGQQENKPNGATLSISVILLQDIPALRTRVPLPSSRPVELKHLQKLQHFASESPGKQVSRHPTDLSCL